jgi:hypothetical protein
MRPGVFPQLGTEHRLNAFQFCLVAPPYRRACPLLGLCRSHQFRGEHWETAGEATSVRNPRAGQQRRIQVIFYMPVERDTGERHEYNI